MHEPATADCHDVEPNLELRELGLSIEPRLGRSPRPPLLLAVHHLGRLAETLTELGLDLAEDQTPPRRTIRSSSFPPAQTFSPSTL